MSEESNKKFVVLTDKDDNTYIIPKHVLDYLSDLRKEDVDKLKDSVELVENVKKGSRWLKWVIVTLFTCMVAMASVGNSLVEFKNLIVKLFGG